jgi:outer membrane lipoprotein-sorting protein
MEQLLKTGMCMCALLLAGALAQNTPGSGNGSAQDLNAVLTRMDQTAKAFRTTQADFVFDQYQKVVNETDTQKGKIYFRRTKSGVEMAAQITDPAEKYIVFDDGKLRMYQPNIDQETVYNTGKNRADIESFMVLGFGGGGHDLLKSFNVRYLGTEEAQGVKADKLELVPKSVKLRNTFAQILLWIHPSRGVSVQQEFVEPSGDYRLDKFSNIQSNVKLPNDVFKLKTTDKTKVISP